MKLPKDSTVRGVVFTLLVTLFLLIPLTFILNRVSLGTASSQVFNLAEVFTLTRGTDAQELDIRKGFPGKFDNSSLTEDPVTNSSAIDSLPNGNQTRGSSTPSITPDFTKSAPATPSEGLVCNPVASTSSTSGIVEQNSDLNRGEAKRQRSFQPASLPHYSFVKFSAYRQSLHTFFVTGISSYVARTFDKDKIAHTCEWHPANGTIPMAVRTNPTKFVETEARMIYMKSDENHGTYSPSIINCTFAKVVGADRMGGLLVLRISTGYDRWDPNLPVVAMEEQAGEVDIVFTPPEKLPFKYAFCGAPIHGKLRADWLLQWTTYHHYLAEGKGHFFFYNLGGLAASDKPTFQQFLDAGLLSITEILDPNLQADYPTWYYHQVLLINDCLHRSRFLAERVFFIDFDEFLQIPAPDTFSKFMKRHWDQPWISFGSMYANTRDCRSPKPRKLEGPLERMLWRRPEPECRAAAKSTDPGDPWLCVGPLGRRKYVVNPRETFAAGVHWVTIPDNGLNLHAKEGRLLHYRSAPLPRLGLCTNLIKRPSHSLKEGWVRDDTVSDTHKKAKNFPVNATGVTLIVGGF